MSMASNNIKGHAYAWGVVRDLRSCLCLEDILLLQPYWSRWPRLPTVAMVVCGPELLLMSMACGPKEAMGSLALGYPALHLVIYCSRKASLLHSGQMAPTLYKDTQKPSNMAWAKENWLHPSSEWGLPRTPD